MSNADFWKSIDGIIADRFTPEGLQKLDHYAELFINGRLVYKRFSPFEQHGCATGGTTHVVASLLVGLEGANMWGSYDMIMEYSSSGRIAHKYYNTPSGALTQMADMYYGYCDQYQPHAVRRIYDHHEKGEFNKYYDFRWDKAGNLGQISIATADAHFDHGRFLFWTEDNRLHTAVDEKHYSYYVYDHSGERRVKLTGESELLDANADLMLTGSLLYKPTLYPSPYLVLSMNEYTKHYYAGAERVAACLGGGGLDIVTHGANHSSGTDSTGTSASTGGSYIGPGYEPHQPEASEEEELKKLASQLQDTANNLFNQSYGQLANRKLDQNDPDCLWKVDVYQDELRRPLVGIPDGMKARVKIDLEKFRTSVIEQQEQHHDESEYVYYYHSDHLGSASWITDHDGDPVQHLQYLPYGEPYVDQRTSGYSERFTFTGKERDEETGYGYFGARYMDHELTTMWLSVDPMADKYPSISPYAYCAWNPVKLVDPDGNEVMENDDEWKIDKQKKTITRVNLNGGDFVQYVNGDANPIWNNTSRGELLNEYSDYEFIDNAPVLTQLNPSEERAKTEGSFLNPIAGTLVGGTGLGCKKMSKAIYDLDNGTYMGKDGSTKTMKKGKNGGLGGRYKAQEKASAKYAKAGRVCTILNISSTLISVRNTESQYRNGEISQVKRWMNHAIDAIGCTTIGWLAPLAYELGQHHGPSTWF